VIKNIKNNIIDKIVHWHWDNWLIVLANLMMVINISINYLQDILTNGTIQVIPVVEIGLTIIVIAALIKQTKVWVKSALVSALILLILSIIDIELLTTVENGKTLLTIGYEKPYHCVLQLLQLTNFIYLLLYLNTDDSFI